MTSFREDQPDRRLDGGDALAGDLRIGTCSWKYPSWHGMVYSAPKGINYLLEYSRKFNTVEVDQWFWSLFGTDTAVLPKPTVVDEYAASVPSDFRFTVKVPNSVTLTHFYKKKKTDPLIRNPHFLSTDLLLQFLSLLEPIRTNLGPLMFQFEYLNRMKMESQFTFQSLFADFITRVRALLDAEQVDAEIPQFRFTVELRNPNWLNESYFRFLLENGLGLVLIDGYYMPPILRLYDRWAPLINQQKVVVLRLHGPDRRGIEKRAGSTWNRVVDERDDDLIPIADMIGELRSMGIQVYVNVNNHYEGSAPVTIEKIKRFLEERGKAQTPAE